MSLINMKNYVSESDLTDLDHASIDIDNHDISTNINNYDISTNIINNINEDISSRLEKLTFRNVNDIIKKNYSYKENHSSTSLDILAMYLKGQKILYTESKVFCEKKT